MKRNFFVMLLGWTLGALGCQSQDGNRPPSDSPSPGEGDSTKALALSAMPIDTIEKKYLLGHFDPATDSMYVRLEDKHTAGSARGGYLHRETYEAFVRMYEAALADGISLIIKSATRNFPYQKSIWEGKWTGRRRVGGMDLSQAIPNREERATKILRYSSMPGTSRHHWGTDFDLNAFENSYFETGQGLKEFEWLEAHAAEYGFCRPYTAKGEDRPHGYEEEKWHWSYLPLALRFQESYRLTVQPEDIQGFQGAETALPLQVIDRYVFGIDLQCL